MRLHVAAAMPEQGGRPTVVAAEVREDPSTDGRRRWHFVVGHVERVRSQTVQGAAAAVRDSVSRVDRWAPCVFVDCGTPQGVALRQVLRREWPRDRLHPPHAYERTRQDTTTFAKFLEAYADGRVTFLPDLPHRRELDRALILYKGGGVSRSGDELSSEDESMVNALCLAVAWPSHGQSSARSTVDVPAPQEP